MPLDDIVFSSAPFIFEVPATTSGKIKAVSLDGDSFNFTQDATEIITIMIS